MDTILTKPKLLLADDSVTMRKVVEMTFAEENIEVFTANDGGSAMLKFVETQPDIVLAHIGLPETNGYQLCEMIKQDETTRHIPVLLLVGSFEPFDEAEAERVNADGYLMKPFASVREVVARVKDLLGHAPVPLASAENDDIVNLYNSSFAATAEIDEFKTLDDSFGDQQFDDEMIETSSPVGMTTESNAVSLSVAATAEQSREFDWSPEAVVMETAPAQIAAIEKAPVTVDESRRVGIDNSDQNLAAAVGFATEPEVNEPETSPDQTPETETAGPSSEFITLVAQRVVEKLSDAVIREIAQDAVPRIAEKLMREALEQDKKE
jgi:DNA-binding response OmpR family regulator